jgi:hypothetical protein
MPRPRSPQPRPHNYANWQSIVRSINRVVDLEATARQHKALQRVRKIRTAEALLRLALIWGPGGQSFRLAAALAQEGGIGSFSDKAVEGRLRKMGDWLAHILSALLAARLGHRPPAETASLDLTLVDGSVICAPGKGQDWRLHAQYSPSQGRFTDLALTTTRVAERLSHTRIGQGQLLVTDRGYARVRNFQAVLSERSDFITRLSWNSVQLWDGPCAARRQRVDLPALMEQTTARREIPVWVKGIGQPLRLIIQPLPPEAAAKQQARRRRKASRNSRKVDPRTLLAAGFLMLLTSLPERRASAEQVCTSYRNRWQVEIGIKRLKSLGEIDELRSADPVLARTWLLAHLIAAVLTDDLALQIVGFPPSGGRC